MKTIIAHITASPDYKIQTNAEHSVGVADIAAEFAAEFQMADWGRMLGLLHDRGKESDAFQAYIRRSSGYEPAARASSQKNHSYIGAVLSHRLPQDKFFWLSNAVAGHHRGLYDIDELELLLQKEIPTEVSRQLPDIPLPIPNFRLEPQDASHLSRMLFSCLVDADWLDTERFMQPEKAALRRKFANLKELEMKMQTYCEYLASLPATPLNKLRCEIQNKCREAAVWEPGFFDLSVPTGGGKTIASVIWALRHALSHAKKRVIIAIPFTSIIVQTAALLREIFGEDNVIEHHSAINEAQADERSLRACENWDAPIIVTTNVRLFESMFSNRPSDCRKLHSLVNSVVILDEIQTLPLSLLQPIVNAMRTYTKLFGTSFLFCTASQPILDGERRGCNGALLNGIDPAQIRAIIPKEMDLHAKLRRVNIAIEDSPQTYPSLADILKKHKRVLCVVSSRRNALNLYTELAKDAEIPTFHLSRSMCAAHLLQQIAEIKRLLSDPEVAVRVVSTQLIEAGVDIDFPVVYRQLAGLDSILQAAGRCNREGTQDRGLTTVFSFSDDRQAGYLRFATDTMKDMLDLYPDADWFDPKTMRMFYEKMYARTPYFDKEGISELLDNPAACQYEEAAKRFHLINEDGVKIIINFADVEKLIILLKENGPSRKLSRRLGRYSVNVPRRIFDNFVKAGMIEEPYPGIFFLPLKEQYDPAVGLKTNSEYLEQTFII